MPHPPEIPQELDVVAEVRPRQVSESCQASGMSNQHEHRKAGGHWPRAIRLTPDAEESGRTAQARLIARFLTAILCR
jgi:hypothetical protein